MMSPPSPSKQHRSMNCKSLQQKSNILILILIIICGVATVKIRQSLVVVSKSSHAKVRIANLPATTTETGSVTHSATGNNRVSQPNLTRSSWDPKLNPLGIPPGKAQNLPSIQIEDKKLLKARRKYGGAGDKQHLGGFSEIDTGGLSPTLFKHMIEDYGVHSFLDIGCGRGFSTSWFFMHGVDVLCAEGSHNAIERSVLPDPKSQVVEHDFSRGPWWPEKTYDVAWSVEFLEHVNLQFHFNYVTAFRKAALIFVTSSNGAGWHHVEVHNKNWWIRKYESYGFKYDEELSVQAKKWAKEGRHNYHTPDGKPYDGFYLWATLKVFVNPSVASLPEHAHLFPEFGCHTNGSGRRECKEELHETPLDKSMYPLNLTSDMDGKWNDWVKTHVDKYQKLDTKDE